MLGRFASCLVARRSRIPSRCEPSFFAPRKGNRKWFIYKNDAPSHFMHSESTCDYYESLAKVFDARRAALNLHGPTGLQLQRFLKTTVLFGQSPEELKNIKCLKTPYPQ